MKLVLVRGEGGLELVAVLLGGDMAGLELSVLE